MDYNFTRSGDQNGWLPTSSLPLVSGNLQKSLLKSTGVLLLAENEKTKQNKNYSS